MTQQLSTLAGQMLAAIVAVRALVVDFSGAPLSTSQRNLVNVALGLVVFINVVTAVHTVRHPGEWDFLCFWLYGHAAVAHTGVYGPAALATIPLPRSVDQEFIREVLDVGVPYPPPSLLLFAPLGLMTQFAWASALWMTGLLIALAFAIVALGIATRSGSIPAVAALVLALPAANETVDAQQLHAIVLLGLAGAFGLRGGAPGGLAAGLAVLAKPYLVLLVVWFAVRRYWAAAAGSIATIALATLASLPLLGAAGLGAYVRVNPASLQPAFVFLESSSLFGLTQTLGRGSGTFATLAHDPAYLIAASILILATLALTARARPHDDDLSIGLFVAAGLLVYPATTPLYTLALAPAILALAKRCPLERIAIAQGCAATFVAGTAAGPIPTFCVTAALWAGLAWIVYLRREAGCAPPGRMPGVASA